MAYKHLASRADGYHLIDLLEFRGDVETAYTIRDEKRVKKDKVKIVKLKKSPQKSGK